MRQARKDLKAGPAGEAPRQGKAFREIFQVVRAQLAGPGPGDAEDEDEARAAP